MRFLTLVLVLVPASALAQTAAELCASPPAGATFTVSSTRPPRISWLMDAQVPANPPGDMTPVAQVIEGFYLQVNTSNPIDTGRLTPIATCAAGTAHAGKHIYTYTLPSPVPVGRHTLSVRGWNFTRAPDGTATATRQEGTAVSIPFASVAPFQTGPPTVPTNVVIER